MLSFADEQGRAAGKVRLIVKLSNVAINEYDMSHFDNNDALGMDGVSVNGGYFAGYVCCVVLVWSCSFNSFHCLGVTNSQ